MYLSEITIERINYLIVFSFSIFFIVYSIINKKYRNVILFIVLSIILKICKLSLINALVIAYVLCLIYGIVMNYHLLDNYENKKKIKKEPEYFSENIVFNYVTDKIKQNPEFVSTRSVRIGDLKPTKQNLSLDTVHDLKKNKKVLNTPIVISNDNYIIDGHKRWYILKAKAKNNKNLNSNDAGDFIMSNIIRKDYGSFIRDLKNYKDETNFEELKKFRIDKYKLKRAKEAIVNIKESVNLLSDYYKDLEKLNVV